MPALPTGKVIVTVVLPEKLYNRIEETRKKINPYRVTKRSVFIVDILSEHFQKRDAETGVDMVK